MLPISRFLARADAEVSSATGNLTAEQIIQIISGFDGAAAMALPLTAELAAEMPVAGANTDEGESDSAASRQGRDAPAALEQQQPVLLLSALWTRRAQRAAKRSGAGVGGGIGAGFIPAGAGGADAKATDGIDVVAVDFVDALVASDPSSCGDVSAMIQPLPSQQHEGEVTTPDAHHAVQPVAPSSHHHAVDAPFLFQQFLWSRILRSDSASDGPGLFLGSFGLSDHGGPYVALSSRR
jgi:hypothetical protein